MTQPLIVTDGWHPTVNPSSRMPIHHYRFAELLGTTTGLLNDLPRPDGGSTIRLVRSTPSGALAVSSIASGVKWMPWWLPAGDRRARSLMAGIFDQALGSPELLRAERHSIARLQGELRAQSEATDVSLGEALQRATDRLFRLVDPDLPELTLARLSTTDLAPRLAAVLDSLAPDLEKLLALWAAMLAQERFTFLGIVVDDAGRGNRLEWHNGKSGLWIRPLDGGSRTQFDAALGEQLLEGRLLPASRLMSMIEASVLADGEAVTHFGNNYGRVEEAAKVFGASLEKFQGWPDDVDSWHYSVVEDPFGEQYPMHLLEVLSMTESDREAIPGLIRTSLTTGRPVRVGLQRDPGGLLEAVLD